MTWLPEPSVPSCSLQFAAWPAGSNLYKDDSDGDPVAPEAVAGKGLVSTPEATTPHELRSAEW